MRPLRHAFSLGLLALLLLPLITVVYPEESFADSQQVRPWGRLDKPSFTPSDPGRKSGYLGRYNPWLKSGENGTDEPPRYRKRGDDDPSSQASGVTPQSSVPAYPSRQPYAPMSSNTPYNTDRRDSYSPQPYLPAPGLAPWDGGLNPNYGNYWNDPYDTLQPDRGLLWSDMWR